MTSTPAPRSTWPDLLTSLLRGVDLTYDEASWAMQRVMAGEAAPAQLAAFLIALRAKGESVDELRALADVMLAFARRIEVPGPSLDIVGTGGDRAQTVNISTMAAIVAASCGVRVVKHGNRAASSRSGAADVLEQLGVNLALDPGQVAEVGRRAGITFCFANTFHPAMRHAGAVRAELGIGTAFNALGPLTNPAQPTYAAVGVADARLAPLMAGVFAERRATTAVFRGDDGLDELTLATSSTVWWVREGGVRTFQLTPEEVGLERAPLADLRGGDAAHNAEVARRFFAGERSAVRDAVVLNAGLALAVTDESVGSERDRVIDAVTAGVRRVEAAIDDGQCIRTLERWAAASAAVATQAD